MSFSSILNKNNNANNNNINNKQIEVTPQSHLANEKRSAISHSKQNKINVNNVKHKSQPQLSGLVQNVNKTDKNKKRNSNRMPHYKQLSRCSTDYASSLTPLCTYIGQQLPCERKPTIDNKNIQQNSEQAESTHLLDIPCEIISRIYNKLDNDAQMAFSQCCRYINNSSHFSTKVCKYKRLRKVLLNNFDSIQYHNLLTEGELIEHLMYMDSRIKYFDVGVEYNEDCENEFNDIMAVVQPLLKHSLPRDEAILSKLVDKERSRIANLKRTIQEFTDVNMRLYYNHDNEYYNDGFSYLHNELYQMETNYDHLNVELKRVRNDIKFLSGYKVPEEYGVPSYQLDLQNFKATIVKNLKEIKATNVDQYSKNVQNKLHTNIYFEKVVIESENKQWFLAVPRLTIATTKKQQLYIYFYHKANYEGYFAESLNKSKQLFVDNPPTCFFANDYIADMYIKDLTTEGIEPNPGPVYCMECKSQIDIPCDHDAKAWTLNKRLYNQGKVDNRLQQDIRYYGFIETVYYYFDNDKLKGWTSPHDMKTGELRKDEQPITRDAQYYQDLMTNLSAYENEQYDDGTPILPKDQEKPKQKQKLEKVPKGSIAPVQKEVFHYNTNIQPARTQDIEKESAEEYLFDVKQQEVTRQTSSDSHCYTPIVQEKDKNNGERQLINNILRIESFENNAGIQIELDPNDEDKDGPIKEMIMAAQQVADVIDREEREMQQQNNNDDNNEEDEEENGNLNRLNEHEASKKLKDTLNALQVDDHMKWTLSHLFNVEIKNKYSKLQDEVRDMEQDIETVETCFNELRSVENFEQNQNKIHAKQQRNSDKPISNPQRSKALPRIQQNKEKDFQNVLTRMTEKFKDNQLAIIQYIHNRSPKVEFIRRVCNNIWGNGWQDENELNHVQVYVYCYINKIHIGEYTKKVISLVTRLQEKFSQDRDLLKEFRQIFGISFNVDNGYGEALQLLHNKKMHAYNGNPITVESMADVMAFPTMLDLLKPTSNNKLVTVEDSIARMFGSTASITTASNLKTTGKWNVINYNIDGTISTNFYVFNNITQMYPMNAYNGTDVLTTTARPRPSKFTCVLGDGHPLVDTELGIKFRTLKSDNTASIWRSGNTTYDGLLMYDVINLPYSNPSKLSLESMLVKLDLLFTQQRRAYEGQDYSSDLTLKLFNSDIVSIDGPLTRTLVATPFNAACGYTANVGTCNPVFPYTGQAGNIAFHLTLDTVPTAELGSVIFLPKWLYLVGSNINVNIALYIMSLSNWPFALGVYNVLYTVSKTTGNVQETNPWISAESLVNIDGLTNFHVILPRDTQSIPISGNQGSYNNSTMLLIQFGPTDTNFAASTRINVSTDTALNRYSLASYLISHLTTVNPMTIVQFLEIMNENWGIAEDLNWAREFNLVNTGMCPIMTEPTAFGQLPQFVRGDRSADNYCSTIGLRFSQLVADYPIILLGSNGWLNAVNYHQLNLLSIGAVTGEHFVHKAHLPTSRYTLTSYVSDIYQQTAICCATQAFWYDIQQPVQALITNGGLYTGAYRLLRAMFPNKMSTKTAWYSALDNYIGNTTTFGMNKSFGTSVIQRITSFIGLAQTVNVGGGGLNNFCTPCYQTLAVLHIILDKISKALAPFPQAAKGGVTGMGNGIPLYSPDGTYFAGYSDTDSYMLFNSKLYVKPAEHIWDSRIIQALSLTPIIRRFDAGAPAVAAMPIYQIRQRLYNNDPLACSLSVSNACVAIPTINLQGQQIWMFSNNLTVRRIIDRNTFGILLTIISPTQIIHNLSRINADESYNSPYESNFRLETSSGGNADPPKEEDKPAQSNI